MSKELSEDTQVKLSLKTIYTILGIVCAVVAGGYAIWNQLEEAKNNPKPGTGMYYIDPADTRAKETWPPTRQEFDMKDQMTRKEFMDYMQRTDKRLERLEK